MGVEVEMRGGGWVAEGRSGICVGSFLYPGSYQATTILAPRKTPNLLHRTEIQQLSNWMPEPEYCATEHATFKKCT